jgi:ribonuclease BN (tRNA processing enzyme)
VTVLGSGTTVPDPDRGPAGLLVQVGSMAWLVDGGSGTMQRCARAGVDPRQLDGGFYTHRHPDHCGDLVPLLFSMHAPPSRTRDYPIVAGEGFAAFFQVLRAAYGHWIDLEGGAEVRVRELSLQGEERVQHGPLTVRSRPAVHSGGAVHLRFEAGGRSVVFSGDTGPSLELIALAQGCDLLIVECGGSDAEPIPGHLTPSDIADVATRARPREIWITHLYPVVDPDEAVATIGRAGVPVRRADDLDAWGQP